MMFIPDSASVIVTVVPHNEQRYPTVGDWYWAGETLHIKVSNIGNKEYEFLVALHECIEALLCKKTGVSEESVTRFDVEFETLREEGKIPADLEPGDSMNAPYYEQHQFATHVERIVAIKLGVDWEAYDEAIKNL